MKVKPFNKDLPFYKPTRGDEHSAGLDLYYSGPPIMLTHGERYAFPTNLAMEIPETYYGRIAGRSGLAVNGIDVLGGVVDSSYRGEIKVILINLSGKSYSFNTGDRVAQMVIERHYQDNFFIEVVDELNETKRGTNGFGSTG